MGTPLDRLFLSAWSLSYSPGAMLQEGIVNDPHLDTAEAARRAGVSGDTIRRWARLGYLHPVRVGPGRRYRIDPHELEAVIQGSAPAMNAMLPTPEAPDAREPRSRRVPKGIGS